MIVTPKVCILVNLPPPEEVACLLVLEGTLFHDLLEQPPLLILDLPFSFLLPFYVFSDLLFVQSNRADTISTAP